jgi:hypothetical protein
MINRKPKTDLSKIRGQNNPPGRLVRSRYPFLKIEAAANRGAHLARSLIENKCWEGLDRIFRKTVDVWTLKGHQGRSIADTPQETDQYNRSGLITI